MSPSQGAASIAAVDGQPINVVTLDDAVKGVISAAERQQDFTLFTFNLDHLVKRRRDARFRAAYRRASFVTADGAPIVTLARWQGVELDRAAGADLILPVCAAAERQGVPVYFFGSSAASLAGLRSLLAKRHPALDIRGMVAPPDGFDPEAPAADAAAAGILASGARLCFVALGAPKQEIFADRAAALRGGVGFLCIGAALDFLSGHQRRAPKVLRDRGLEWCWRLAGDPRRLGLRYWRCAVAFAGLAASERLGRPAAREAGHPGA